MTIDFKKGVPLQTPAGTLKWPWLQKPDTRFNADGTFTAQISFVPNDIKDFVTQLDSIYNANLEYQAKKNELKKIKGAAKPYGPEKDYKTEEETGNIVFRTKANAKRGEFAFRPKLFEANGTPYLRETAIGSGTIAKLALNVRGWYVKGEAGISLGLEAAQILKLVPAGRNSAEDYGFSKEEMPEEHSDSPAEY